MKFETLYEEILDEMFNTSIDFDPIVSKNRIEQMFDFYEESFLLELDELDEELLDIVGVWNFGLKNVTQNTYRVTHKTEKFVGPIFGIAANWLADTIKKNKDIKYILFGPHFSGGKNIFNKQTLLYKKMANKFTNDKIVRDIDFEKHINLKLKDQAEFVVLKIQNEI